MFLHRYWISMFLRSPAISRTGNGSFRRFPHVELAVGVYSSTTAEAARTAPNPPTHPTTHHAQQHSSTYSSSTRVRSRKDCCCIVLRLPCFYDSPPYRGRGTAPFSRSPLAVFGVTASSFADSTLCRRVGRVWHGRAAAGTRVALGRGIPKRGILTPAHMYVKIQNETTFISVLLVYSM